MKQIRVATYNIHKGVQGLGPWQRHEIHRMAPALASLQADVVCLQEVRGHNHLMAKRFADWPVGNQAEHLKPQAFDAIYKTNAITRHGEHGNALLTRWPVMSVGHHDVSDHRFEQRGILHTCLVCHGEPVHVLVVHLGLFAASRRRQVQQLGHYIQQHIAPHERILVAGDFNDWQGELHVPMQHLGLSTLSNLTYRTFPAKWPVLNLDRLYLRGFTPLQQHVPREGVWPELSDHLPLVADLAWSDMEA